MAARRRRAEPKPADAEAVGLGPLPDRLGYVLRRTHSAVFARFRSRFADLDIRPVQLGILTVVGASPGLRPAEVSAALGINRANLVPLLDGLAARRLIDRTPSESDRRARALRLTASGEALLRELQAREDAFEAELEEAIGPEGRSQLLRLLRAVSDAFGPGQDVVDQEWRRQEASRPPPGPARRPSRPARTSSGIGAALSRPRSAGS